MKLLRSVLLILTQAATSVVGCPAARHAGAFDPSNTAQLAGGQGSSTHYRKGGISSIQRSCVRHGHLLFIALPSLILLCS